MVSLSQLVSYVCKVQEQVIVQVFRLLKLFHSEPVLYLTFYLTLSKLLSTGKIIEPILGTWPTK